MLRSNWSSCPVSSSSRTGRTEPPVSVAGSSEERTRYSFARVRAETIWPSEKCSERATVGRPMPAAPMRKSFAGLCTKRSSGVAPGTSPDGASGTAAERSGWAGTVSGVL